MIYRIERLGRRGDGVAQGVLAPMTLPGEEVSGDVVDGRIAAPWIITPSPDRVRAGCRHYRACGGCSLMHASDGFVARWKADVVVQALSAQGIVAKVDGVATSPAHSRRRAVLSGRRTKKGALLGFHARASDVVIDLDECAVLRPAIVGALPLLREIVTLGASRAAELTLWVLDTPAGLDVAVAGGKPLDPRLFARLSDLAAQGDLARLSWREDGWQEITRRPPLMRFGGTDVVIPPAGFVQATAEGEAALLAVVRRAVAGADRVLDLFAGAGTFTLPMAQRADVHAVEGLAAPLWAMDQGWRRGTGLRRVTHEVRDLTARPLFADELDYHAIVIDPPRTGAEAQAQHLAQGRAGVIAWVSCDPVSFARDARHLIHGGYHLDQLYIVDQFRWSHHVETAAIFRR